MTDTYLGLNDLAVMESYQPTLGRKIIQVQCSEG
jgi:hypothetical protein